MKRAWTLPGRTPDYNRLHPNYPYLKKDGLPDLVYSQKTQAIICDRCDGLTCSICYGSGYRFLDPNVYHNFMIEQFMKSNFKTDEIE